MDDQFKPCPFCGSEIRHIESMALSFDPPRAYHEWHHVEEGNNCWIVHHRGTIVASATDLVSSQRAAVLRWNRRPC
jgi:hypothetical protein